MVKAKVVHGCTGPDLPLQNAWNLKPARVAKPYLEKLKKTLQTWKVSKIHILRNIATFIT